MRTEDRKRKEGKSTELEPIQERPKPNWIEGGGMGWDGMAWHGSNIRGVALPWLNRLKGVEWREQLEELP